METASSLATTSAIKKDFNHVESIYWVFTQLCNDQCAHCYNLSGPKGERISLEECLAIVEHLPNELDRLILSGGEPLAERKMLYAILEALQTKYDKRTQIMLQTNGDLMTAAILDELLARGVTRIDLASIDRYHKKPEHRHEQLERLIALFKSRGMHDDNTAPLIEKDTYVNHRLSFGYWGATEDMWLGGNWARGRAMEKNIWKKDGTHNFCAILSGARGFLGGTELPQEISIQLWKVNPCCPGTKFPLGDARTERVADILQRSSKSDVFLKLNEGDAYGMAESFGVSAEQGLKRAVELQNVCLWCDEVFEKYSLSLNKEL
jgi:organic radical activating enzyme